jgi:CheY-like chemotaxis protein
MRGEKMRKTCLLIDDDEDDTEIFALAAGEADPSIECFFARDGIEALQMLLGASFVPDYIFLDLNMPQMSGKECLIEIRKRAQLDDTPVIIYSTSSSQKDILETHNLGASSFITKPPLISTLTEKLREVFQGSLQHKSRIASR